MSVSDSAPPSTPAPRSPRRPLRRRLLRAALLAAAGVLCVAGAVLLTLQSSSVSTRLVNAVLRTVELPDASRLTVGEVSGTWLTRLRLEDLRWQRGDTLLASVAQVQVGLRPHRLLRGAIDLSAVEVAGVEVTAAAAAPGPPSASAEPAARAPAPTPGDILRGRFYTGPRLHVSRVALHDARFAADRPDSGLRVPEATLKLRDLSLGGGFAATLDTLLLRFTTTGRDADACVLQMQAVLAAGRLEAGRLQLDGPASRVTGSAGLTADAGAGTPLMTLRLNADPLALSDVAALGGGQPLDGDIEVRADLSGPAFDRLTGQLHAAWDRLEAGGLTFGPSHLQLDLDAGDADLQAAVDCEDGAATLTGRLSRDGDVTRYSAELRSDRLPRRLPQVDWWPDFVARTAPSVGVTLQGERFADAAISFSAQASAAAARVDAAGDLALGETPRWRLTGLDFSDVDLAAIDPAGPATSLSGGITAEGRGATAAALQGRVDWNLRSSRVQDFAIDSAGGSLTFEGRHVAADLRAQAEGASVAVDALRADLSGNGSVELSGVRVQGVDLARLTDGAAPPSDLGGALTLKASGFLPEPDTGAPADPRNLNLDARFDGAGMGLGAQRFSVFAVQAGLRKGRLQAKLDARADGGSAQVELTGRPFADRPSWSLQQADFAGVDLSAWLQGLPVTDLNGALTAEAGGASPADPDASVTAALRLDGSRIGAAPPLTGDAHLELAGGRAAAAGKMQLAEQTVQFSVRGGLADDRREGTLTAEVPFALLAAFAQLDSLPADGGLRVDASFAASDATPPTAAARLTGRGSLAGCSLDSLLAAVRLENGVVAVDTLELQSCAASLTASGVLALSSADDGAADAVSDLQARLELHDLAPLRRLAGADVLTLAEGAGSLRVTGPPAAPRIAAQCSLATFSWNDLHLHRLGLRVDGELDEAWRPVRAGGAVLVRGLQSSAAHLDTARLRLEFAGGDVGYDLVTQLNAGHRLAAGGRARRDSALVTVSLDSLQMQALDVRWTLAAPAAVSLADGRVTVQPVDVRADSSRVLIGGVLDRNGAQDFHVAADNVGLDIVTDWLGREDLGGRLDARLDLTGTAAEPSAVGRVTVAAELDKRPVGVIVGDLDWNGTRARLAASIATPAGDSLRAGGEAPLRLARSDTAQTGSPAMGHGDVDLYFTADGFPLQALESLLPADAVAQLGGALDADLHLRGSTDAPSGSGSMSITGGVVDLPTVGFACRDLQFSGRLDAGRLRVERFSAKPRAGKGGFTVAGSVNVASLTDIAPDLTLTADAFPFVDTPDMRIAISGSAALTGSVTAPVVRGSLTAAGCTYYITPEAMESMQAGDPVELTDEDLRMLEETFGYDVAADTAARPAVFEAADLDLELELRQDNWVRKRSSPRLALEITGRLQVRKEPYGEMLMYGSLEPLPRRGYFEQFGRMFKFTGGEVTFDGGAEEVTFDVRTEYSVRSPGGGNEDEVVIKLGVRGDAESMELILSSEPEMSETDIMSYITTGRSSTEARSASDRGSSDAAALATDIGMSQVSGAIEEAVQGRIGLDVLQVRYDAQQGMILVAGRYIDPQVYVGFQQPLQYNQTSEKSSQNPYQTVVEVEYEVYRWLLLNLQGDVSLLRAYLRATHAY